MQEHKPDPWILEHSPIAPSKLHALGAITLFWNQCEMGLFLIFAGATKIDSNVSFALTHEMGDVTVCNRIREILELTDHSDGVKNMVIHVLKVYDINRQNRNQLTHFMPGPGDSGMMQFWRQKGPKLEPQPLPCELKDIRRVATEILALSRNLVEIGMYFLNHPYGNVRRPLPEKLPLPDKLWKPPPPDRSKRKRQRPTSRA